MPFHLSDHLPQSLRAASQFGWIGVDLFFVLSGFLIGSQVFRSCSSGQPLSLRAFYRRRAYRILPAYLAVLLLYVAWPAWREAPGMQPWWQFTTFTENFLIDYGVNHAFSHAWSLCVEEHFYLLFPLLTLLLLRRPAAWKTVAAWLAVVVCGVLVRSYILLHVLRPMGPDADDFGLTFLERIYYPSYTRLDGLAAGVALAALRSFRPMAWQALLRRGHALTLAGIALISLALWCATVRMASVYGRAAFFDVFGYLVLALGFALLVASAVSRNGLLARWRVPGATLLSTLSFSLYLTHKEAVHLLFLWAPGLPDGSCRLLPILMGTCLAVAAALYLGIERPFLWLRDRGHTRRTSRGALAAADRQARIDPAL